MSSYKNFIIDPVKEGLENNNLGIPIPLKKLSKITNYIEKGQYVGIGGKPTSGKSSLVDYIYMMNIYRWWKNLDVEHRPKLKMFYFNMKSKPRIKWQKWICLHLKLEYSIVIDIPTLTGGIGKLYDLDDKIISMIKESAEFFEEFEHEVLTMINGPQSPSSIFNRVHNYMESIGELDKNNKYYLDQEHIGQYTFVFVDNTDYLLPESDGFQLMNLEALKKKHNEYNINLINKFNINIIIVIPSNVSSSRIVKDGEPNYKELGLFSKSVDLGLVCYNPYNENNNKYLGYPIEETVIRGKTRFRTITVVRNSKGLENITVGTFFIGECGYFAESPHPNQETEFESAIELIERLP